VTTHDDFVTLRDSWQSLLQHCDHSIFSTWEYLSTWWTYYGKGANLKVLLAQENEETLSIAPLMVSNQASSHFGGLHKIQFIGHGSDYADFILPNDNPKYLELFFDHLLQFSEWDIIELEGISEESNTTKALSAIHDHRPELELNEWSSCSYIRLSDSFKGFMKGLSRNVRKNLARRMRRLQESYKVEFKTQNDFDSVRAAMEVFFNLHDKRWQSKGEPGVFANQVNRDFHVSLAETFNEKGWLALYFLSVDDEPISAAYTYDYGQKKYGCLTGFEPEFGQFGVGNLLKIHILEDCFRKRFREYDLGRGSESYKTEWATGNRKLLAMGITKGGWRVPLLLFCNNIKKRFHTS